MVNQAALERLSAGSGTAVSRPEAVVDFVHAWTVVPGRVRPFDRNFEIVDNRRIRPSPGGVQGPDGSHIMALNSKAALASDAANSSGPMTFRVSARQPSRLSWPRAGIQCDHRTKQIRQSGGTNAKQSARNTANRSGSRSFRTPTNRRHCSRFGAVSASERCA